MARPRLLLHTCCGPCATVCVERLLPDYDVTLLWYNPNLDTREEAERRREAAGQVARHFGVELVALPEDNRAWRRALAVVPDFAAEPEGGRRCAMCLRFRIARAAQEALARQIPYFDTTLSVSPHKDPKTIRGALRQEVEEAGFRVVTPHVDFRAQGGFQRSAELSRQLGLYRQNYCGCVYSRKER